MTAIEPSQDSVCLSKMKKSCLQFTSVQSLISVPSHSRQGVMSGFDSIVLHRTQSSPSAAK